MRQRLFLLLAPCYLLLASPAFAYSTSTPGCTMNGDVPSLGCLAEVIVNIIGIAFLLVGFVALIFLFLGAIKFIVSRGDPKAIQGAQKTITFAIIGLIVVVLSFAIVNIVTNSLGLPDILHNFSLYQP